MGLFGIGKEKKSDKTYICSKYPTLDLVITPHPTKDRSGKTDGVGHHVTFKSGRFSTNDPAEMEFIETNEYYKNGTIVEEQMQKEKDNASKKAKLEKEAEAIGYKLVKA